MLLDIARRQTLKESYHMWIKSSMNRKGRRRLAPEPLEAKFSLYERVVTILP
jgi:hypothetical protein